LYVVEDCGGVLVFPGDLVVADGDGVIVVPRERAVEVAKIDLEINEGDQRSRAERYQDLGMKPDQSVKKHIEEG
jgi:4-hydroxy-4-methyl-2-oxoglutarate aldolase